MTQQSDKDITDRSSKAPSFNEAVRTCAQFNEAVTNATLLRTESIRRLLSESRDINYECGYPDSISVEDYKSLFKRLGAAKRVVNILPEKTWATPPAVYETEEEDETLFEEKWKALNKKMRVFHYLNRIDILSGVGRFGVLIIGLDDGKPLDQPVEGIDEITGQSTGTIKERTILYLKPFDEALVQIKSREMDQASPRYGLPKKYAIVFASSADDSGRAIGETKEVHWTRVLHVADGRESSEVYGTPRMEAVYNHLLDLRKVLAGSSEMFWKGGFPGLSFETQPDIDDADLDTESLKDQAEDYMNGLQRYFALTGMTVKSLTPQVANPDSHVESNIRMIAASLGVPYRIFIGTEEAKMAGAQDVANFNERIASRQINYAEPYVLRAFVDRLILLGVLPEVEEYFVSWEDLNTPTNEEKAKVAALYSEAMAKYVAGGVEALIPSTQYLTMFLGLSLEEAQAVEEAAMTAMREEEEGEEEGEL